MREARGPSSLEDVDLVPLHRVQVAALKASNTWGRGGDGCGVKWDGRPLCPLSSPPLTRNDPNMAMEERKCQMS